MIIDIIFICCSIVVIMSLGMSLEYFLKLSNPAIKKLNLFNFNNYFVGYFSIPLLVTLLYEYSNISLRNISIFSFILIFILIIYIIRENKENVIFINNRKIIFYLLIVITIISFGSEGDKVFQGYPYDRFVYASASISYLLTPYNILKLNLYDIFSVGNSSSIIIDNLKTRAFTEINLRPAQEYVFGFLGGAFQEYFYALPNAYENFLRISGIIILSERLFTVKKFPLITSLLISLGIYFSMWGQIIKDYNAWSMAMCIPIWVYIFFDPLSKFKTSIREYHLLLLAFTAAFVVYADASIYIFIIFFTSYGLLSLFHTCYRGPFLLSMICSGAGLLIAIMVNPNIPELIIRQLGFTGNSLPLHDAIRSASMLLLPYIGTVEDKVVTFNIFLQSFPSFSSVIEIFYYVIGSFGFSILSNGNKRIIISIFIFICLFFYFVCREKKSPEKFYFLVLIAGLLSAPLILLALKMYYGWGRSVVYSGFFLNAFLWFLAFNINEKYPKYLSIAVLTAASLILFFPVLYANIIHKSHEFNIGYEFSRDRSRPLNQSQDYKKKYSFDTTRVRGLIRQCSKVQIRVEDDWQYVYAQMMLKSLEVPYFNSHKLLTGLWDGDEIQNKSSPGWYDCLLTQTEKNGVIYLDLFFPEYGYSSMGVENAKK